MKLPAIDFTPDPPPAASAGFDSDACLASNAPPKPGQPFDTSRWSVVPATVQDERGFTAEDYESASLDFLQPGDGYSEDLAAQATAKGFAMRQWLVMQRHGRN